MRIDQLDFYFPFVVFAYGLLVLLSLHLLNYLASEKLAAYKEHISTLHAHRKLALLCFYGGALWALQNLYFADFVLA